MKLRIGTRGSALALAQTELVRTALESAGFLETEVCVIKTQGDRKQGTAAAGSGDKRDWMHDLEVALLEGEVDVAVHSAKDVPAEIHASTALLPVLERSSPYDVFVGKRLPDGTRLGLEDIGPGATIGTASVRRKAQLRREYAGCVLTDHRGNVPTRLQKLEDSQELTGIVLAQAGLVRLGLFDASMIPFSEQELLPAVNQGILAVQYLAEKIDVRQIFEKIVDPATKYAADAERACVITLDGDCHSAVGCFATVSDKVVTLTAEIYSHDGTEVVRVQDSDDVAHASVLGARVGQRLLKDGGARLLAEATGVGLHKKAV